MKPLSAFISYRKKNVSHDSLHGLSGLTLLELLAVMTIIGLTASIAVPRMLLAVDAISASAEEHVLVEITAQIKLYAYLRHTPQHLDFQDQSIYRNNEQDAIANFTHLMFKGQQITWNTNGYTDTQILEYSLRGREKQLVLD
jgi:prepilin-type N-terminal cleavage/methylation domain-containing protein